MVFNSRAGRQQAILNEARDRLASRIPPPAAASQYEDSSARAPPAHKSNAALVAVLFEMSMEAEHRLLARTSNREGPSKSPRSTTRTEIERGRGESRVAETPVSRSIPLPSPSAPLHMHYVPPSSSNASTASQTRAYSLARPTAPFTRGRLASPITPSPATPPGHVPTSASKLSQHAHSTSSGTTHTEGLQDGYRVVRNVHAPGSLSVIYASTLEVEQARGSKAITPTRTPGHRHEAQSLARTTDAQRVPEPASPTQHRTKSASSYTPSSAPSSGSQPSSSSLDHLATYKVLLVDDPLDKYQAVWNLVEPAVSMRYEVRTEVAQPFAQANSHERSNGGQQSSNREVGRGEGRVTETPTGGSAPLGPPALAGLDLAVSSSLNSPTPPSLSSRLNHLTALGITSADGLQGEDQIMWNVRASGNDLTASDGSPSSGETTHPSTRRSHRTQEPLSRTCTSLDYPNLDRSVVHEMSRPGDLQDEYWAVWNICSPSTDASTSGADVYTTASAENQVAGSPSGCKSAEQTTPGRIEACAEAAQPLARSTSHEYWSGGQPSMSSPSRKDNQREGRVESTPVSSTVNPHPSLPSSPLISRAASSDSFDAPASSLHLPCEEDFSSIAKSSRPKGSSGGLQDTRKRGEVNSPSVFSHPRPSSLLSPVTPSPFIPLRLTSTDPTSPDLRRSHSTTFKILGVDDPLSEYQAVWTPRAPGTATSSTHETEQVAPTRALRPEDTSSVAQVDNASPTCKAASQDETTLTDRADDLQGEYRAEWNVCAPGNRVPTLVRVASTHEAGQQPARPPRDAESSESTQRLTLSGEAPASAKVSQHGLASGGPPSTAGTDADRGGRGIEDTRSPSSSDVPASPPAFPPPPPSYSCNELAPSGHARLPLSSPHSCPTLAPAPDASTSPLGKYWAAWTLCAPGSNSTVVVPSLEVKPVAPTHTSRPRAISAQVAKSVRLRSWRMRVGRAGITAKKRGEE
ncbi:uncharacterized protein B0H18DRAFT_1127161 [Fomitopsis serialis]|uniref:uncharacterized protein n=1 Tax=Fomitopsis serialis TaxID=139415 RepID=UPI002007BE9F|nr:uncharacterized protein B0H18DRAFT_1127161 [Neoantrodia serialis]KAH9912443.1 hypothetical protein B0H18DRAFT_1127161 [Neoantrodia serialis]